MKRPYEKPMLEEWYEVGYTGGRYIIELRKDGIRQATFSGKPDYRKNLFWLSPISCDTPGDWGHYRFVYFEKVHKA